MLRIISAAIALLIFSLASPTSALADDDEDFTPITTCGAILTEPGKYKVVNDLLDCSEPKLFNALRNGISIFGNDITLDLGGHTIRCAEIQPDDADSVGVFLEGGTLPGTGDVYGNNVRIRNGVIENCGSGVLSIRASDARIDRLTIQDGGRGIVMRGGFNNDVRRNHISGMLDDGIGISALFGMGGEHKVFHNLVHDNGVFGIFAEGIDGAVFQCNRSDSNFVGGISLGLGATGIDVRKNVANDNGRFGVVIFGFVAGDVELVPVAAGNTVRRNTALGNFENDLAEMSFDIAAPGFPTVIADGAECSNTWRGNAYITEVGPYDCIAPSRRIDDDDDDDGCAPEFGDEDDDDDDDDD